MLKTLSSTGMQEPACCVIVPNRVAAYRWRYIHRRKISP